ncbi:MAG: SH3 domain-containing protein [Lachnospiraceae bacterium]|nr:SH3 domain-containing protein [Lachnospiraceae bacterium]
MNHSKQNKKHVLKEAIMSVADWIVDHNKIIMPLVLVVCVAITIALAVNANHKEALEKEAELAAAAMTAEETPALEANLEKMEFQLEEDAHPEVNNLVRTYYDAQASGDLEVISSLNTYLNDIEKIRVEEMSKYIESYPVLTVYTKPGMTENTYVAYVYSEVKFEDVDTPLPGMQTYYIGQDENSNYFINDGTYDDATWDYIREITLQDDVVDLNNKVAVEYNELLANDEELNEFIAYLKEKINEDVGEILAEAEAPVEETEVAEAEAVAEGPQTMTVVKTVRATDVVNIRSSDSENADKIDKAQIGQEFPLIEHQGNGWSKVEFEGQEAFIKSDYLETAEEEVVEVMPEEPAQAEEEQTEIAEAEGEDTTEAEDQTETEATTEADAEVETVTVKENVRVRKSASTDSDILGTAYTGEKLELVMKQADGWTKVKYKGHTAYVKSDYVE